MWKPYLLDTRSVMLFTRLLLPKQDAPPAMMKQKGLQGGSAANNNLLCFHMDKETHTLKHTLWLIWVYPSVE